MRKKDSAALLDRKQATVADAGMKGMIPIGRPFLDFVLSALADAGFTRACLVIGPEHGAVRDYYTKEMRPSRIGVHFAIQDKPMGTADAVLSAQNFADQRDFVVINSDTYYPVRALESIRTSQAPAIAGFNRRALLEQGNITRERITRFGALDADEGGYLRRILVGKAAEDAPGGDDALASMNCWLFDSRIFEACRLVPKSVRDEYELPQAVQLGIDRLGMKIRIVPVHAGVLDLSSRSDIASVAEQLQGVEVRLR